MLNNIVTLKSRLQVTQGHWKWLPFESFGTVSYLHSIVSMAISCSFLNIARYWSIIAFFILPAFDAHVRWVPVRLLTRFGTTKTRKTFDDMFSCFDRILEHDRQTDILPQQSLRYA